MEGSSDMDHGLIGRGKYPLYTKNMSLLAVVIRAEIQRMLFPPTYQTVGQTHPVEPGDKRIWTALQIFVELRNETTLHIPFREASKVCLLLLDSLISLIFDCLPIGLAMGWSIRGAKKVPSEGASIPQHCGRRQIVN